MAKTTGIQGLRREKQLLSVLFLIPIFLLLAIFILYSILYCFKTSLYNWNGLTQAKFIGLRNWSRLMGDNHFWLALGNNFKIVFISIFGELPLGLALAYFLDSHSKGTRAYKLIWFLPILMSTSAIGTLFGYFLNNYFGPIAGLLNLFGIQMPSLLGNTETALYTVCIAVVGHFVPFYMIYYLAGLSSIGEEIYEAAIIDGATRRQYFFKCALPIISPTIRNAIVLQLVGSLKTFDMIYVMTQGGPSGATELMATYMYKQTFLSSKFGYGAAIASAMFIIITVCALTAVRLLNGKEEA